jgi:hypothetical protein
MQRVSMHVRVGLNGERVQDPGVHAMESKEMRVSDA